MEVATLVEFFSPNPIENVLGAFAFTPRRLVFLVGPGASQDAILSTQRALERRIPGIQIRFFSVPDTQLPSIVRTLEELWREYPDSVFDFTGGSEPMLLSAYAFAYQHDAPMLHINIQNHCFINIHRCEELAERFAFPQLTLEDHLSMNGTFLAGYGYPAPDPQWFSRIRAFCALVLEDQHRWKEQCLFIQMAAARSPGLTVDSEPELRTGDGARVSCDPSYLLRLTEIGMLSSAAMVGGHIRFTFPDLQLRRILCDSGIWLELYTYILVVESGRFSDVRLSVRMGWGQAEEQSHGTAYNEIDVVACAGITPLFISCKSGIPSAGSMNEILVYARKFGGPRARAAMVTSTELAWGFVGLRKRAADLGTVVVDESDIRAGRAQRMLLYLMDAAL